jgi:predicted Zn-ribbon and HTH transcriptional regulator
VSTFTDDGKLGSKNVVDIIKNKDVVIFYQPYTKSKALFYLCVSFASINVFIVDTLDAFNKAGFYNTNVYSYRGAYKMVECYLHLRHKYGFVISPKCGNVFDDFVVENRSKILRCKSNKLPYNMQVINRLIKKGYMPNLRHSNIAFDGFEIFEIDKILDNRFIEWSAAQTLDALRFLIRMQRFCIKDLGFTPFDPHIANVMFDFHRPQYIDYGTFYTCGNQKQLRNINKNSITRSVLHFANVTNKQKIVGELNRLCKQADKMGCDTMLAGFAAIIDMVKIARDNSVWVKYGRSSIPTTIGGFKKDFKNEKYQTIFQTLQRVKPKMVLDLGGNKGYFATLATLFGAKVVCLDYVDQVVSMGYGYTKKTKRDILFLRDNLINGIDDKFYNSNYLARFNPDFCMASAIIHHLKRAGMPFQKQFDMLHRFTNKYLFVELICDEDGVDLNGFKQLLSKKFKILSILPSYPKRRKFALCIKK